MLLDFVGIAVVAVARGGMCRVACACAFEYSFICCHRPSRGCCCLSICALQFTYTCQHHGRRPSPDPQCVNTWICDCGYPPKASLPAVHAFAPADLAA